MPPKPRTWKDIADQRRKENFVGRSEELHIFQENFLGENPNWMVLSVTGEGGVGKSTLLKRYTQLAQSPEINANVVYCDDHHYTPVDVMAAVAEQLSKIDIESKGFNERHKKYRELLQQIESDPNAPRGMVNVIMHGITDFAVKSLRHTPGFGVAMDFVDEKAAGDAVAELAEYAIARWGNKDEVQLVREPEKILTPLFVELMNEATEKKRLIVMFDVFERTSVTLSSWLIELFNAQHGDISSWASFILSGRDQLEQQWTELAGLISHVELEPFTPDETAIYLSNQGITDETLVRQIYNDTSGLPVLVQLLAATDPVPGQPLPDISKDAVKRFLKWISDEKRQLAALLAAIPRQFDKYILGVLLGDEGRSMFNWLVGQSYVRSSIGRGWFYHEKVRELMLKYQEHEDSEGLSKTHLKLADFLQNLQNKLSLEIPQSYGSLQYQKIELDRIYHFFSANPNQNFSHVVNKFLLAFYYRVSLALKIINTMQQVVNEASVFEYRSEFEILENLVKYYEKGLHRQVVSLLNQIDARISLDVWGRQALLVSRGDAYNRIDQNEEAIADYTKAIELNENFTQAIAWRGILYYQVGKTQEALADLNRAIELDSKLFWVFMFRGNIYRAEGKYEEALDDFRRGYDSGCAMGIEMESEIYIQTKRFDQALAIATQSIEIDPNNELKFVERGNIYKQKGDHEKALADLNRAIELNNTSAIVIANRGLFYFETGKLDDALSDFNHAIELDSKNTSIITNRGKLYTQMSKHAEALLDFDRAIELGDNTHWVYGQKGRILFSLESYDDAIAALSQAYNADPSCSACIAFRGYVYQTVGKYNEAIDDFNRAIELNEKSKFAVVGRGLTYNLIGKYEESIRDLTRALELDEKDVSAIVDRAKAYRQMGKYEEALKDYNHAIELDGKYFSAYYGRGKTHQLMGEYDLALSDLTKIIQEGEPDGGDFSRRASVYIALGDPESAQKDLEHVLSLECRKPSEHYWRGLALILSSRIPESIVEFEIAFADARIRSLTHEDDMLNSIRDLPEFKTLLGKYD